MRRSIGRGKTDNTRICRGSDISFDRDHRRGVLLALCGFALLSCGDAVMKSVTGATSPLLAALLRFIFAVVGLGIVVYRREGLSGFRSRRPRFQVLRGLSMSFATIFFFCAIYRMPLADVVAIGFIGPMLTLLMAMVFLGEPVRLRSWLAIIASFCGVLIVLRPNVLALGLVALFPLLAATGNSLYLVSNRLTVGDASILAQQLFAAAICTPVLVVVTLLGHFSGIEQFALALPPWHVVARCALVALTSSTAHWLVFRGTMLAGAGAIAPTVYVQIVLATVLGWVVFSNPPSLATLLGIGVIVGSGLYLWRSGRAPAPQPID